MELLLAFLVAMSVTMALIPPLMQLAARFQFLDSPNERKVHAVPVPRVGGIAMAAGMLLALGLSGSYSQPMPAFVTGILVLLTFGVWDDRCTLNASTKFVGQIVAVLIVMIWGNVEISSTTLAERHLMPEWLGWPLTFLFLLGVTNAINLADGLDGLAGGTTLLSLAALALLAFGSGTPFVGGVAVAIMGAILGFLRFNTHPARVFMGDGGSQLLGFSAAVLAVVLTQDQSTPLSSALPLLLLGIPIIDTLMVMTQRILAGRSPFSADRKHIHHRLLARGFDHHEAVVAIYLLQGGLFVTAWFLRYESDLTILLVFAIFSLGTLGVLYAAERAEWRWRTSTHGRGAGASALARAAAWLREPHHLPLWTLGMIACIVAVFFAVSAATLPIASLDVRLLAALLSVAIAALLVWKWRDTESGWTARVTTYVALATAAYLNHEVGAATMWPLLRWLVFGLLVLCLALRFRLASDRTFRVTPLDVLVIFIAVVVPNLPGSVVTSARLGESIAQLIAMMYAVETLLGAGTRWWRLPCGLALAFLLGCALRGGI